MMVNREHLQFNLDSNHSRRPDITYATEV
jgi:hypothetical protein